MENDPSMALTQIKAAIERNDAFVKRLENDPLLSPDTFYHEHRSYVDLIEQYFPSVVAVAECALELEHYRGWVAESNPLGVQLRKVHQALERLGQRFERSFEGSEARREREDAGEEG